ncbi:MAG: DUF2130 domain-containing protein, partial [Acholeplasmatales bacterium]|nr:DUF2130 domain-containing protein [Acholeplasmatales bacterium]
DKKLYEAELTAKLSTLKSEKEKELSNTQYNLNEKYNQLKNEFDSYKNTTELNKELAVKKCEEELRKQINNLKSTLELEKTNNEASKNKALNEQQHMLEQKYNNLLNEFNTFKATADSIKELAIKNKEDELNRKIIAKVNEIDLLKETTEIQKNLALSQLEGKLREEFNNKEAELNKQIEGLTRAKASLNVKQTGENLESWCNNTYLESSQNGFFNCTWTKDNDVVKNEGETKGSKADFIFKIYADETHNEDTLLTSLCLEMKDENPDSTHTRTNESYFAQLDKNRIKKNCKYAVLVSNLELNKSNDIPIYKAPGYNDMYVVRPAYMMTFINMVTSLYNKFSSLVLNKTKEEIDLKDKKDILDEFDQIKKSYLDKPIQTLVDSIEVILKQSESINLANEKIRESINKIRNSYIDQIKDKIDKFELKLNREIKKIDKLN